MKRSVRGILVSVLLGGLVLGIPACKKSTAPSPVTTPTPIPVPVRGVLAQFPVTPFSSGIYVGIPLPLTQGGILDVTVDWTFQDTWMYVYVAKGTCTFEQLAGKTCPFIVSSEVQFPKPRVVFTKPIPPGTYSLILYNVELNKENRRLHIGSDNTEGVSCQIGLTVGVPIPAARAVTPIQVKPVIIRP